MTTVSWGGTHGEPKRSSSANQTSLWEQIPGALSDGHGTMGFSHFQMPDGHGTMGFSHFPVQDGHGTMGFSHFQVPDGHGTMGFSHFQVPDGHGIMGFHTFRCHEPARSVMGGTPRRAKTKQFCESNGLLGAGSGGLARWPRHYGFFNFRQYGFFKFSGARWPRHYGFFTLSSARWPRHYGVSHFQVP